MENMLKPGTISNRIAKAVSVVFAVFILGYLVYCAHDAAKETNKKTYMPSSKSGLPTPLKKSDGKNTDTKNTNSKKKKKKPVFIHTSKSGNFDVLIKKKEDEKKK